MKMTAQSLKEQDLNVGVLSGSGFSFQPEITANDEPGSAETREIIHLITCSNN